MSTDAPELLRDVDAGDGEVSPGALLWRFPAPRRAVSSAPMGGGMGLVTWALNVQVPADYGRTDPAAHLRALSASLGLRGRGVGMLTAVDVAGWRWAVEDGAAVAVTVGVTRPTWAAAPDDCSDEAVAGVGPGTINVVASVPAVLDDAALVNAATTVTEAKAQALWDGGVAATGTASDAVCVVCRAEGPAAGFGGPRSYWGSRLARVVHRAVLDGLGRTPR